eukprot:GHVR01084932.1.p1 GENE.GHVR01084932.1~~GHVR01084932.1.p1  ORF type:complete len:180 (-),score=12.92 GHVR01084932.1:931-1470(-)
MQHTNSINHKDSDDYKKYHKLLNHYQANCPATTLEDIAKEHPHIYAESVRFRGEYRSHHPLTDGPPKIATRPVRLPFANPDMIYDINIQQISQHNLDPIPPEHFSKIQELINNGTLATKASKIKVFSPTYVIPSQGKLRVIYDVRHLNEEVSDYTSNVDHYSIYNHFVVSNIHNIPPLL